MKYRVPAPERLVELPPNHKLAHLGVLVDSVPPVPPAELPLVKWRVRSTLRRRVEWRRRVLRVAVASALLFLAGGVVGAVVQPSLLSKLRMKLETRLAPASRPAPATSARGRRRVAPPEQVPKDTKPGTAATALLTPVATEPARGIVSAAPLPATESITNRKLLAAASPRRTLAAQRPVDRDVPSPSPSELPGHRADVVTASSSLSPPPTSAPAIVPEPVPRPSSAPAPASTPAVVPQASEQALLAKALRSLSIDRDPERALAALDEHTRRFGAGALAPEAARLRTWALLLSGRRDAALAELYRQSSEVGFDASPGGQEYRLLRGELHAKAGRWREALPDFDLAVRAWSADAAANGGGDRTTRSRMERALWGRASARSHLGDQAGANADLREYLRRFPHGRFAASAARLSKDVP